MSSPLANPLAALAQVAADDTAANNNSRSPELFMMTIAGLAAHAEIAKQEADLTALRAGMQDGHIQIIKIQNLSTRNEKS